MKKILSKSLVWILGVVAIATFFRFFELTKHPVSYSMDEVAVGYNAYSILKTAKDEHGIFLPLAFQSVGDYKPPVDVYLTVVSESIFGFGEFATRFPVALAGVATCVVLIFLLRSLGISWAGSIFGGLWLAVLPWHVHFSRGSAQAITSLFFLVSGFWQFVEWSRNKKLINVILSVIFFSLSVWAFHAERFFVPILALFLVFLFRDEIKLKVKKIQKQLWLAVLVLAIFVIPFIKLAIFTPAIAQRATVTSILREQSLVQSLHNGVYSDLTQKIFDNDLYLVFRHWSGKYLNYFDLRFWFWEGLQYTPPGYPDLGLMYALDLPLFLYGIYVLIRSKNQKPRSLALFGLLTGPLAASFTMNEQHPERALIWIPFFGIIIASGAGELLKSARKFWIATIYLVLLVASVVYFGDIYMHQFPRFYSESWQYGYKQVSEYACANLGNYNRIFISDTFGSLGPLNTGTPPLYVLFYCPADRENYLLTGQHLSKFAFRRPNKESSTEKGKLLLIGSPWDFLDGNLYGGKIINKVVYPSGIDAFWMVEKN